MDNDLDALNSTVSASEPRDHLFTGLILSKV